MKLKISWVKSKGILDTRSEGGGENKHKLEEEITAAAASAI